MKIAIAQLDSIAGNIAKNIDKHLRFIIAAAAEQADLVVFPELSITGYEPTLAADLATHPRAEQFTRLQAIAEEKQITIAIGLPTPSETRPLISMGIFQPLESPQVYSKRYLDPDEYSYFENGTEELFIKIKDTKIAPAICYESLQEHHLESAVAQQADFYLASVAIPDRSIEKAHQHYATMAAKYQIPILLTNAIGTHDNFVAGGRSAIWNQQGELVDELNETSTGLLIYETKTQAVKKYKNEF